MELKSIYLSRFLKNKVYTPEGEVLGTLKDLGVSFEWRNPKVVVAAVKVKNDIRYVDWDKISINKEHGQYNLTCSTPVERKIDDLVFLKKYVLDKQIIDVNGRKVVRANDVRLVLIPSGFFVAAVDIGFEGLLRRIGLAKPLKRIGVNIPGKLMLWNDIATVYESNNITLTKTYSKLYTLHPSDLADIIEDFDTKTGMLIFSSLDNAKAADVLEELEEDTQFNVLDNLSKDRAADILEEMPPDEAADVLDGMDKDRAEELLSSMEKDASDEVRELLEYEEEAIGSIMNTDVMSFNEDVSISDVIQYIRENEAEEEIYYVYVTDNDNKLIGTIKLKDIIIAEGSQKLKDIMNTEFMYMHDTDDIEDLYKSITKYNLLAMPIVDDNMNLLGNVISIDVIYELMKLAKI